MAWEAFRKTLRAHVEEQIHPHVVEERATWFRSAYYESTEVDYLDLTWGLLRAAKPRIVLETGSHLGTSTVCMALALRENKEDGADHGVITSVEKDGASAAKAEVLAAEWGVSEFVNIVVADSLDYLETNEKVFEFVFFDSTRPKRVEEFTALKRSGKLTKGALLLFHDTSEMRAKSMPHQMDSQSGYLQALKTLSTDCRGPIVFPLSRGLHLFEFRGEIADIPD